MVRCLPPNYSLSEILEREEKRIKSKSKGLHYFKHKLHITELSIQLLGALSHFPIFSLFPLNSNTQQLDLDFDFLISGFNSTRFDPFFSVLDLGFASFNSISLFQIWVDLYFSVFNLNLYLYYGFTLVLF